MRGTRSARDREDSDSRFIPAGAGNTRNPDICHRLTTGSSPRVRGTHVMCALVPLFTCGSSPRVRGTHAKITARSTKYFGSSPRVRGTRWRYGDQHLRDRFIPAGAGNTSGGILPRPIILVHPRGCGEHGSHHAAMVSRSGSSPRVRGTHRMPWPNRAYFRFIPAGAGNTPPVPSAAALLPVHPRGCGEHPCLLIEGDAQPGSSPRVRGTRQFRR